MKEKSNYSKKLLKNIDGGASTQANYQFQYNCATIIAINMYTQKFKFKELFCEIYEDVLGIKSNNHVVGIQIKYRESKYGPYTINTEEIVKTIKRFVYLNEEFGHKCDKFIFMSNMPIVYSTKKPLEELCQQCSKNKISDKEKKIIQLLEKKTKLQYNQLVSVLSKIEYQMVPDKEHVKDTIVNKHLSTVKECKILHPVILNDIADSLIDMIAKKSTLIKDSLTLYSAFLENVNKENQIVNTKRVTIQDIKNCIEKKNSLLYLNSTPPSKLTVGSFGLIDRKMNLGKINSSEIDNMRILTQSSISHFLEEYYEEEEADKIAKILDDVSKKLHTIQAECETSASKEGTLFGSRKLELIEEKLHKAIKDEPEKFHRIQYEHLKGILGIMMTNCQVPFSKKPKGGWI